MPNGKIMANNHIIGEKAVRYIKNNIFPPEWVVRTMNPDYGIDLDVELFDYEDGKCITLGEHLFLQVKGTEHPQYGKFSINRETVDVIKYQLEVAELNLVERMGSAFPVLLVLVDLVNNVTFQICLNDYIRKVLPIQNIDYKKQKTIVINIPVKNQLLSNHLDILRWYGKRTKIYSMFQEMISDIDDFGYMDDEDLVRHGKQFVNHYRQYDVLNSEHLWYGFGNIKSLLDELINNDCVSKEAISFVQRSLGYTENWEDGELFEDFFAEHGTNAYLYAQKYSIRCLGELIRNSIGMFETYCREWFMPGLILGVHNDS